MKFYLCFQKSDEIWNLFFGLSLEIVFGVIADN